MTDEAEVLTEEEGVGKAATAEEEPSGPSIDENPRNAKWYWWKFVHNLIIHPFLALPWEPKWAQRAHDWTARRCFGGG
jgi:hypothetical protein